MKVSRAFEILDQDEQKYFTITHDVHKKHNLYHKNAFFRQKIN